MFFALVSTMLIILGMLNAALGALTIVRNRRDALNIAFSGIAFSVGMWCIGIAAFYLAGSENGSIQWMRFYYTAPSFLVSFLVWFMLAFPNTTVRMRTVGVIFAPAIIVMLALMADTNAIVRSVEIVGHERLVQLRTSVYLIYSVFIVSFFAIGLFGLLKKSHRKNGAAKQAKLFFIGSLISAGLGLVFNLILPGFGNYKLIWAGPLATTFFAVFVGMGMLRYKMFDIRFFVIRALAYTVTNVVLAVLYIAPVIILYTKIFGIQVDWFKLLIATCIGLVVATNYNRLQHWFNRSTARIFFREAYEPTELVSELNKTLISTMDIQKLLGSAAKIIEQYLKPEHCYFIVRTYSDQTLVVSGIGQPLSDSDAQLLIKKLEPDAKDDVFAVDSLPQSSKLKRTLSELDIAIVLKFTAKSVKGEEALVYMIVSGRKSGKSYDAMDLQVLNAVSNALAIAMQNALHYEEIQKFNVTLQGRVEDATRKLRATNDKLKKLDETKDEFISMASHQLRTPLTSIKGYLSMVLEGDAGKLNSQQEEMLKQSYMSSQRMVNLIADLLNLSRLNTGKFVIDPSPTDLRMIVDQEVGQLRETAKAKGLTLNWVAPKMFTVLPLDDGKIHQVVMNFIDNAIYYTPPGGSIDVTLVETPTAVEFRVKDNGIGVPRSVQHHLFTKFYRAENARQARPDGTGLGIFMAKKVIAAQGGSILFESKEGKGSTFGFRFNKEALKTRMAAQNPDTLGSPASKPVST